MLRKFVMAAAIVAFFAGSASAQAPDSSQTTLGIPLKSNTPPTQEQIDRQKANDRAYDAALHKIPDKKSTVDPWGNIRQTTPAASKNKAGQ